MERADMTKLAYVVLLTLVAVVTLSACGFGDSGLEAKVSLLESEIEDLKSAWDAEDFEKRLSKVEDSLYGSYSAELGPRGVLDRLYEVENRVRLLE
jgi:hypothetical protein